MLNKKHKDIFFSVMICCYNSQKYIRETIDSVIAQTHNNWEMVIINDGSTDDTENIILDYQNRGLPIIYAKQPNLGFAAARNKAISIANAEWIAIIDHDDICLPNRLEIQSKQIIANPSSKLFFGDCLYFDNLKSYNKRSFIINKKYNYNINNSNFFEKRCFNKLAIYGCFVSSSTVVFNKNASLNIGKFNSNLKSIADYDFFLHFSKKYLFSYSNQILSKWRIHEFQSTKLYQNKYFIELNILLCNLIFCKYINLINKFIILKRLLLFNLKMIFKILLNIKQHTYERKYFS